MNKDHFIDITKLPIIRYEEYHPPTTAWQGQEKIKIEPESEAVAEVNRRMEKWMEEQRQSFWRDAQMPYVPKWLKIFLVNSSQMEDILHGRARPTNIPEGSKLYDIRCFESTQIANVWGLWMVHPDFPEYISGSCVPSEYVDV